MTERWATELAEALSEVARRMAGLAESVTADWPDRGGREWADRAGQLRRDLIRQAATAAEWGAGTGAPAGAVPTGMRLGGTGGQLVDDGTGVRIAELPPR